MHICIYYTTMCVDKATAGNGPIIGGVLGGITAVVAITLIILALLYCYCIRRSTKNCHVYMTQNNTSKD